MGRELPDTLHQHAPVKHVIDCEDFKHRQRIDKKRQYPFLKNFCFFDVFGLLPALTHIKRFAH